MNFRTETLSAAKHKKLPSILNGSLDSSTNENSSNDTNDSNKIASSTFSLNSSSLHFDQISNRDLPTNPVNSALLPKTYNKKNFPKKIQAVEKTIFGHRNVDIRNFDTTVTIDILNESDRFSRQSLDPLITNRDSTISRVSTVILSINIRYCSNYFISMNIASIILTQIYNLRDQQVLKNHYFENLQAHK